MILCTLGVKEILVRHTGVNLKQLVMDIARLYGLDRNQVYSVTTDNGSNMVKTVQLMNDNVNDDEEDNDEEIDYEDEALREEELIQEIEEICSFTIHGFRCASHTLQLAILDVVNNQTVQKMLNKFRSVIKHLRNQIMMSILRLQQLKKPILDCVTR
jgi:hypothetical protein